MKTNEDLLGHIDQWLAARRGTASFRDVMGSGDSLQFAAYLLRGFRDATRQAVLDQFKLKAAEQGFANAESPTAAFLYMVDRIAEAWLLTDQQKASLLGVHTCLDLDRAREGYLQSVPPEVLERGAILLDIVTYINEVYGETKRADEWVRTTNYAPLFRGRSPLATMIDGQLKEMRAVREYLRIKAS